MLKMNKNFVAKGPCEVIRPFGTFVMGYLSRHSAALHAGLLSYRAFGTNIAQSALTSSNQR